MKGIKRKKKFKKMKEIDWNKTNEKWKKLKEEKNVKWKK